MSSDDTFLTVDGAPAAFRPLALSPPGPLALSPPRPLLLAPPVRRRSGELLVATLVLVTGVLAIAAFSAWRRPAQHHAAKPSLAAVRRLNALEMSDGTTPLQTVSATTPAADEAAYVVNDQTQYLSLRDSLLELELPVSVQVDGQWVSLIDSRIRLTCRTAAGQTLALPVRTWRMGADPAAWQLAPRQGALTSCSGSVALARGGRQRLNTANRFGSFKLDRWTLARG